MSPRLSDKEEYKKQYPSTQKWLNVCIVCQTEGYKPELPQKIQPGILAENIRKYWYALEVNDIGICCDCAVHIKQKNA